ncbi:MAG: flagellar basal body P-ring protein FlgI [Vicinamibacterales bacterium]
MTVTHFPYTRLALVALVASLWLPATAGAQGGGARLKDVATLQGIQPMPLMGYGLVIGLNKTGDRRQTIFTSQSLASMLERMGIVVTPEQMKVENIAAVMVTTELPPFSRTGARIDVTVSSIGDARSLQGGTLLVTPLRGLNGEVYAVAQGPLTLGGFGGGAGGNSVQVNHLTVGRVPGGGLVQTALQTQMPVTDSLTLVLRDADFSTAKRLAEAVNTELGGGSAHAVDSGTVVVRVPDEYRQASADLMARLDPLLMDVDTPARVVINERTGTVVVGAGVRLGTAAVAHGNLSVRISTKYNVSQPAPLSTGGETVVVPEQQVDVSQGDARLVTLDEGTTLDKVVAALNALGATPRDIIAILQALKQAGALRADVVVI